MLAQHGIDLIGFRSLAPRAALFAGLVRQRMIPGQGSLSLAPGRDSPRSACITRPRNGHGFDPCSRKDRSMRDTLIEKPRRLSARLVADLKTWGTVAALVAALACAPASRAQAQEVLRWKLKTGDVLKYATEQKQVMSVKQMGREHKQTRTHGIDYRWTVKDVSANGDAEIVQKIEHLTMKVAAPPLMPFEYDFECAQRRRAGAIRGRIAASQGHDRSRILVPDEAQRRGR